MSNERMNTVSVGGGFRRVAISIIVPVVLLTLSSCASPREQASDAAFAARDNSAMLTENSAGPDLDGGETARGVNHLLGGSMGARKSISDAGGRASDKRMVAYSISLALTVKDIDETRAVLIESVKRARGFIVEESMNYVAARIPPESADEFIRASKALGKTEGESITGTDITDQYRDNIIRLDNVKNVRQRYIALLERAHTVNEVLSIERELQRVNLEIEMLEGRIKYAEQSVEYSYIRVSFREKTKPGPIGWIFYGLYRGVRWLFVW